MKKYLAAAALALLGIVFAGGASAQQQITRVGVIDLTAVYTAYYRDSAAVRELQALSERYQRERETLENEIVSLRGQYLEAQTAANQTRITQLQQQLTQRTELLRTQTQARNDELRQRRDALLQSDQFYTDLMRQISSIAESEGFSIVVRRDSTDTILVWWNQEVDITQLVITRLTRR